jgi:RNA polymerase sigma-70 factor (ECF subfamily)
MVRLNRAVALAHVEGPNAGLALIETMEAVLVDYQPFCAAKANLLQRAGRSQEAVAGYEQAIELTGNSAEKRS